MRYIAHDEKGEGISLTIKETATPSPDDEQVLIKITAFGINRADTLQRQGKYPPPPGESDILGLEVSGEIVKVGSKVTGRQVGETVFGLVPGGGYAEYVCAHYLHVMPVPDIVAEVDAAGIAEVFLTAYQSVVWHGQFSSGQKALVHAGASGVGLAAIQLITVMGGTAAVTASTDDKLAVCQQAGAELLINYQQQDFAEAIKSTWQGVDLIIDFVAGDYLNRNLKCLNADGSIVYLAMLKGRYADKLDMALLLGKRARIIGSTLRNRSDEYKAELVQAFSKDMLGRFAEGQLKPNIDSYVKVADIEDAHRRMELNQTCGKLICVW